MNPQTDAAVKRSLPVLRALIDALDHDLLQLIARRNGLVAQIAEYKRDHQKPIRDDQREREIIEDRRSRSLSLGLAPDFIESLFRLIIWGSRDRQAALKAQLPTDVEPKSIGVIGGCGAMGRCMARLFGDLGHAVMVADLDTELTPQEAAAADVVIISVPIEKTVSVIHQLGPLVRQDALMMDVTSIKEAPVSAMLEASAASVVGTHPLFDPTVHSFQGQRTILCRGRGDDWFGWLESMFRARGVITREATPKEHDHAMSIVQVLVHFATEVMGWTLVKLGTSIEETLAFTSPIYLMELLMTARHFAQSSELYGAIEMSNPAGLAVMETFINSAKEWCETVRSENQPAFNDKFDRVHALFGSFTDRALEQSSFLIDRLVERA